MFCGGGRSPVRCGNAPQTPLALQTAQHLRLQVSVQDVAVVDVFDGEADLGEPVEDLLLRERLGLLLEQVAQVPRLAELRDDAELALVFEAVHVAQNERVVQLRQQLDLLVRGGLLLGRHRAELHLLEDIPATIIALRSAGER